MSQQSNTADETPSGDYDYDYEALGEYGVSGIGAVLGGEVCS